MEWLALKIQVGNSFVLFCFVLRGVLYFGGIFNLIPKDAYNAMSGGTINCSGSNETYIVRVYVSPGAMDPTYWNIMTTDYWTIYSGGSMSQTTSDNTITKIVGVQL